MLCALHSMTQIGPGAFADPVKDRVFGKLKRRFRVLMPTSTRPPEQIHKRLLNSTNPVLNRPPENQNRPIMARARAGVGD